MNVKWLNPAGGYFVGTIQEETGILIIVSQANKTTFVQFNDEGVWFASGGNPAWSDDFVDACVRAGYDVVSWEFQDATISIGEKLPYWDTCIQV